MSSSTDIAVETICRDCESPESLSIDSPDGLNRSQEEPDLPPGPPPKKPPRTFAYEIYSTYKVRRLSKSRTGSLSRISTGSKELEEKILNKGFVNDIE